MKKQEFESFSEKDRMNRVLEGKAFFASVHTPNYSAAKKFKADPAFMISLGLEGAELEKAKSYGLKIREADKYIPMPYVKLQRKVKAGKTPDEVKPLVVDSMQKKVPASILIGNESKVICKFGTYWADTAGGTVGNTLFKVQIRELVPFTPSEKGFVKDEGGFKIPDASPEADQPTFDDDDGFEEPKSE